MKDQSNKNLNELIEKLSNDELEENNSYQINDWFKKLESHILRLEKDINTLEERMLVLEEKLLSQ